MTLGLDIGQSAIKGARVGSGLLGRTLTDFFEKPILRDHASDSFHPLTNAQCAVLKTLVSEKKIKPDDIIAVSLPGHLISSKEMTLPFTDLDKVRKAIPYEAEGQMLLNMDEVILDYQILSSSPESTRVLVFAASKEMIKTFLDRLLSIGIDPVVISVDQIALFQYCLYMNEKRPINAKNDEQITIDLGAVKTVICSMSGKTLRWARTTPIGTDQLLESFQSKFSASWEKSEALIRDLFRPIPLQKEALAFLPTGFSGWINDVEVSLKKIESDAYQIHLCGSARISLRAPLSNTLHRNLIVEQGLGRTPDNDSGKSSVCFAQAAGLALLPAHTVNFRRNEFAHEKERFSKGNLISIGVALFLLLILFVVNLSLHANEKEKEYALKKEGLSSAFRSTFPETKNVVDEIKQSETVIADMKKRSDLLGIGMPSPLLILKQVTDAIPKGIKIYVSEFTVEGNHIQIEAETVSFDFVDQIKGALLKNDAFSNVVVGDAKVTSDQQRIGFRMQILVKEKTTKAIN